jgi:anti-sigma regulatory factor (Ser/Thr protein kinase)
MWAVVLPCIPAMVPVARAFTRGLLGGHPRAADAELVVSEYAANAVRYGTWGSGGVMSVVVAAAVAGVRVEVADHGPDDRMRAPLAGDAGVVAEAEVAEDEGGRGLVIVDAVAERWGHYGVGGGSLTAWAELGQWDAPDVAGSAWTGSPAWIGV